MALRNPDQDQLGVEIRCRVTDQALPTGFTARPATWGLAPPVSPSGLPQCKQFHACSMSDASLGGLARRMPTS
jgi:hypothetical protein